MVWKSPQIVRARSTKVFVVIELSFNFILWCQKLRFREFEFPWCVCEIDTIQKYVRAKLKRDRTIHIVRYDRSIRQKFDTAWLMGGFYIFENTSWLSSYFPEWNRVHTGKGFRDSGVSLWGKGVGTLPMDPQISR